MNSFKKIFSWLAIILIFNMNEANIFIFNKTLFVGTVIAAEAPPEFIVSEELDYPMGDLDGKEKRGWLSRNKWWVVLGTILVTGAAVAASSGSGDDSREETGDFIATW